MRVLAAPDKFRGTATAQQVADAVVAAARDLGWDGHALPMADGGEGLLEVLGGADRTARVTDALGRPVDAGWRLDGDRAVLEAAAANGLQLVGGAAGNDPVAASTRGVGELLAAALAAGARRLVLGVGGSATTDGGAGALALLEERGLVAALREVELVVACDVTTRFTDAAAVFGPQKGAGPDDVTELTGRLEVVRERLRRRYGVDPQQLEGSGAAGGLAGGLAVLGGRLVRGVDLVAAEVGLDSAIAAADVVVTGEGRLDATSLQGKVVGAVASRAAAAGRPVLVVCGVRDPGVDVPGAQVQALVEEVGERRATTDTVAAVREVVTAALPRLVR